MVVNVSMLLALDEESEHALEVVRKASRILREEYGIWISLHLTQVWSHDPLYILNSGIPQIHVNGIPVFKGKAPSVDELITAAIALMNEHDEGMYEIRPPRFSGPPKFSATAET